MNIGFLHSGDLDKISPGGVSQYIEKIIINNNEKNDITIFGTCSVDGNMELFKKYIKYINGKKYFFVPITKNDKKPLSIYYFITIFKIYLKNKSLFDNIDIFYAQRMEYVLPFKFIFRDRKVAMAVHGSGKYSYIFWGNIIGSIYNFVERVAILRANKVIVLLNREEFGVPYYKEKFKKHKNKIVYGKVPIDLEIFKNKNKNEIRQKYNLNENDNVILYCGRIENNPKRVLLFPAVAKQLIEKIDNLKWIMIGNGNDLENLKSIVKEFNLEDVFKFEGHVNHGDDLANIINCADVSILLSNFEGICMSALESIACHVPIVATDVGDVNEYINSGFNGVVIPNNSDDEIVKNASENIQRLLLNDKVEIDNIVNNYDSKTVYNELITILKNA